jgi:hypothetical protein
VRSPPLRQAVCAVLSGSHLAVSGCFSVGWRMSCWHSVRLFRVGPNTMQASTNWSCGSSDPLRALSYSRGTRRRRWYDWRLRVATVGTGSCTIWPWRGTTLSRCSTPPSPLRRQRRNPCFLLVPHAREFVCVRPLSGLQPAARCSVDSLLLGCMRGHCELLAGAHE